MATKLLLSMCGDLLVKFNLLLKVVFYRDLVPPNLL